MDLAALTAAPGPAYIELFGEAPRLDRFVGRERELALLTQEEDRPRIFVVRGVAGIGKSCLAARVGDLLRGSRHLFWHRVRPWDSQLSLMAAVAEFLAAAGKPAMWSVMGRGLIANGAEVLNDELEDLRALLVFDDAHEASSDAVSFFRLLKDAIAGAKELKAIVFTRRSIPFYDRRDVRLDGLVREIDLGGLTEGEIRAFLVDEDRPGLVEACKSLGGHPLFLQLVRTSGDVTAATARRDLRAFIRETVYAELPDAERRVMKLASLYGVPLPRDAFLLDSSVTDDVFVSLVDRGLLMPSGSNAYGVHDAIQEFFQSILTDSERSDLGSFAVGRLRRIAERAFESRFFALCVDALSNALQLPVPREEKAAIWERLGDAHERIGDLPAALVAFKESTWLADDPQSVARLHRKSAAVLFIYGDMAAASNELDAGIRALGAVHDTERAWLDLVRGRVEIEREEWEEAQEAVTLALQTFQLFRDHEGEAQAYVELANVHIQGHQGDPEAAQRYLEAAIRLAPHVPGTGFLARVHRELAHLFAYRLGRAEEAISHLRAIDGLPGALEDPQVRRSVLMLRGWIHLEILADYDAAENFFGEAIALARRIHDAPTITWARFGMAIIAYCRGDWERARREFGKCAEELMAQRFDGPAVESLWMVAECCLLIPDFKGFERIAKSFTSREYARGVEARKVHLHVLRGVDGLLRGNIEGMHAAFRSAQEVAERGFASQEWPPLHLVHFFYGVALEAIGEERAGKEHVDKSEEFLRAYGLQARLSLLSSIRTRLAAVLRPGVIPQ